MLLRRLAGEWRVASSDILRRQEACERRRGPGAEGFVRSAFGLEAPAKTLSGGTRPRGKSPPDARGTKVRRCRVPAGSRAEGSAAAFLVEERFGLTWGQDRRSSDRVWPRVGPRTLTRTRLRVRVRVRKRLPCVADRRELWQA